MESKTLTVMNGDEKVEFPRLDLSDLYSLGDEIVARREKVARELAAEEKLDRSTTINIVMDIRNVKPTWNEVLHYAGYVPEGTVSTLKRSLAKKGLDGSKQQEFVGGMGVDMLSTTALDLVLDIQQRRPQAKGDQTESPLPGKDGPSTGPQSETERLEKELLAKASQTYGSHKKGQQGPQSEGGN
jgi:hypothetical protein